MENKNITISKAMKIYNVRSFLKMILSSLGIYSIFFLAISAEIRNAVSEPDKVLASSRGFMVSLLPLFLGSLMISMTLFTSYDITNPGGKFFRSIKGSFYTYYKMRNGVLLHLILSFFIFITVIYFLNVIFPHLIYGKTYCLSYLIFFLMMIVFANLLSLLNNQTAEVMIFMICVIICIIGWVISIIIYNGKIGIFHIIAGIAAAILVPVSHRIRMENYRNFCWN